MTLRAGVLAAGLMNQSTAQVVDGSLKFKSGNSTQLTRTPSSAGNQKTWSWSAWVKRSKLGGYQSLFADQVSGGTDGAAIYFNTGDDTIIFEEYTSGGIQWKLQTSQVFRDCNAWFHLVVVFNSPASTANERMRIYVNGSEVTDFAVRTNPSQNFDGSLNRARITDIASYGSFDTSHFNGYLADVQFVDGQALGPDSFGFTDPLTNTWRPKKYDTSAPTNNPNNGTVWSNNASVSSGSFGSGEEATKGFDGNTGTKAKTTANGASITITFSGVTVERLLRIRTNYTNGTGSDVEVNDVSYGAAPTASDGEYKAISGFTGALTKIKLEAGGSVNAAFSAIEVDGVILQDSTTTNNRTWNSTVTFGTNGFYLPLDGNSPIGEDQSGQGNNWTPTNFGGSVALDNPQVSGARPILNTLPGGTQAGVGVFGSKENKFYTVTTANGSVYQFDITSGDNPSLEFIRGATYRFDYTSHTSHPLRFSSTNPDSSTTAYTQGTNTSVSNVITITVPHDAPDTLYYYCTAHASAMNGAISVTTDNTKADQYASSCVLALPLVSNVIDVSTSIACTSTTKTVTAYNATAKNEASNFYDGSYYFDGTSDKLKSTTAPEFVFGTSDFTVEAWVYKIDATSALFLGQTDNDAGGRKGIALGYNGGRLWLLQGDGSTWSVETQEGSFPRNKWVHVAASRDYSATKTYYFVDGQLVYTYTSNVNLSADTNNHLTIGSIDTDSLDWDGYIQDFRIYRGVAKYTSNFVVPSRSPDILPDSPSGVSGSSKLTKITDGAVTFDGTDYLTVADGLNNFSFGTGAYTVEGYLYPTTLTGNGDANPRFFCCGTPSASSNRNQLQIVITSSGQIRLDTNGTTYTSTAGDVSANKWQHIAVARDGSGNLKAFVDGRQVLTQTSVNNDITNNDGISLGIEAGVSSRFTGFMSNVRILKGTALYTANFTPPTAPLTDVTNTKLLCCQSNTSAESATVGQKAVLLNAPLSSTPFTDSSPTGATITNNGSITAVSAGTNSFNITNAASQNGSNQWFTTNNTNISFQGTWTVDIYFKLDSSASGYNALINSGYGTQTTHYMYIGLDDDEKPYIETSSSGSRTTASDALSKNVWYHGRVTQDGSTMTFYVNGTSVVTKTAQTTDLSSAGTFTIGSLNNESAGANSFHGLIGPVRIVDINIGAPSAGGDATSSGTLSNSFGDVVSVNGDAAAITFNPFNTDITTVRGQESGYATLNPLAPHSGTFSDGNLSFAGGSAAWCKSVGRFQIPSSGKYYFEGKITGSGAASHGIGLAEDAAGSTESDLTSGDDYYCVVNNTSTTVNKVSNGSATSLGSIGAFSAGDLFGVAVDGSTKEIWVHKNGIYLGGNTPPGTALLTGSGNLFPAIWGYNTDGSWDVNFGQRPFKFSPPDGFQPLNGANLRPSRVIARPDQFVGVKKYTSGDGSAVSVDSYNFAPDLIFIKDRDGANNWSLFDTVRGYASRLDTTGTGAAQDWSDYFGSFDPNGFTVKAATSDLNRSTNKICSWSWKAGGSKNTFNVDDEGFANASDVGMNVGGQNNNAFNTDVVWSNYITPSDSPNKTRGFNGNTGDPVFDNSSLSSGQYITFTPPTPIAYTKSVAIYTGGVSGMTYQFNGGSATSITASTRTVIATGSGTFTSFALTRNTTTVHGWAAIEIDGKILVDNGVTPAQDFPSIAPTGCSVGTKQGFSIIKYNSGGSSGNYTVPHGMGKTPKFIIHKQLTSGNWWAYHADAVDDLKKYFKLNSTESLGTNSSNMWGNVFPNDITFGINVGQLIGTSIDAITYLWADVPGLQKFGSFTGNGSENFVSLDFRPAIVWVKRAVVNSSPDSGTDYSSWTIMDSTRLSYNGLTPNHLFVNKSINEGYRGNASSTSSLTDMTLEPLSNGFYLNGAGTEVNANTGTYIYCAWAETPEVNLYGGQSNAR